MSEEFIRWSEGAWSGLLGALGAFMVMLGFKKRDAGKDYRNAVEVFKRLNNIEQKTALNEQSISYLKEAVRKIEDKFDKLPDQVADKVASKIGSK